MAFNGAAPTLAARLFACGLRVRANFVARGLCGGWRAIGSPKFHLTPARFIQITPGATIRQVERRLLMSFRILL